jgi:hypothetical protein
VCKGSVGAASYRVEPRVICGVQVNPLNWAEARDGWAWLGCGEGLCLVCCGRRSVLRCGRGDLRLILRSERGRGAVKSRWGDKCRNVWGILMWKLKRRMRPYRE